MKRRVLITGCAGFIGKNLFSYLEKLDYEVFGIDVNCVNAENTFNVDINNYNRLFTILKEISPEFVVHLAARIDIFSNKIWEYETNIIGVQNLIRSTEEIDSIKRVIWTSTQLVNKLGSKFINYNYYNANTTYGASKVLGEQLVRNGVYRKEWVIVRPSTVWGPGMSNHYFSFIKYIDKGLYFNVTRKKVYKSFSYIENTCFQIEKIVCSNSELVNRRTFYLSDYIPLELHSWTNEISKTLNRKKIYSAPLAVSYVIAAIFFVLNKAKFISKAPVSFYNIKNIRTTYINNNDLEKITGPLPASLKQGIKNTIKWYTDES